MIADIVVRDAGVKGKGVFALRGFAPGEFIFRRRHGRVVASARVRELSADDRRHLCELDRERSALLLPPGCYLSHSCEPNAMRSGVKVFAWRRIRRGEEITIDYRLNAFGGERWKCRCGARTCKGWSAATSSPSSRSASDAISRSPLRSSVASTAAARRRAARERRCRAVDAAPPQRD